jgi:hypothetical protein
LFLLRLIFVGSLLLWFLNETETSMSIGWIGMSHHLYPRILINKLTERLSEVPTGELQLVTDHPSSSEMLEIPGFVLTKVLPQDRLLLLHVLHITDTVVIEFTDTLLHTLVETKLFWIKLELDFLFLVDFDLVSLVVLRLGVHLLLKYLPDT